MPNARGFRFWSWATAILIISFSAFSRDSSIPLSSYHHSCPPNQTETYISYVSADTCVECNTSHSSTCSLSKQYILSNDIDTLYSLLPAPSSLSCWNHINISSSVFWKRSEALHHYIQPSSIQAQEIKGRREICVGAWPSSASFGTLLISTRWRFE